MDISKEWYSQLQFIKNDHHIILLRTGLINSFRLIVVVHQLINEILQIPLQNGIRTEQGELLLLQKIYNVPSQLDFASIPSIGGITK